MRYPQTSYWLRCIRFCLKKNLNASRPSEHPAQGEKCQNAYLVGSCYSTLENKQDVSNDDPLYVCICMERVRINRVKLPIVLVVS